MAGGGIDRRSHEQESRAKLSRRNTRSRKLGSAVGVRRLVSRTGRCQLCPAPQDADTGCPGRGGPGRSATDGRVAFAAVLTDLRNHRVCSGAAGGIGEFDPSSGRYTLYISAQSLHMARDRGGGLGVASHLCWAARVAAESNGSTRARRPSSPRHDAHAEPLMRTGTTLRVHSSQSRRIPDRQHGASLRFVKLPGGPYPFPRSTWMSAVYPTVPTGVTRGPGSASSPWNVSSTRRGARPAGSQAKRGDALHQRGRRRYRQRSPTMSARFAAWASAYPHPCVSAIAFTTGTGHRPRTRDHLRSPRRADGKHPLSGG